MSDDSGPVDDTTVDSNTFDEWLAHTAESRDISKSELMNQMVTSYWILDELNRLRTPSEADDEFGAPPSGGDDADRRPDRDDADPVDTEGRSPAGTDRSPAEAGRSPGKTDRSRSQRERPGEGREPERDDAVPDGEQDLSEILEEIRSLRTAIGSDSGSGDEARLLQAALGGGSEPPATPSDLQRRLEELSQELEEHRSRQETYVERISDELTRINGRLDAFESEVDEKATAAELRSLSEEVESTLRELEAADEELEAWIDGEFDAIEAVMQQLLEAIESTESRLDTLADSYRDDVDVLRDRQSERDRLVELKETAIRRGVSKAACGSCDRTIKLAMIEAPYCPHCDHAFSGISEGGWNPLKSPTLETESIDAPEGRPDDHVGD